MSLKNAQANSRKGLGDEPVIELVAFLADLKANRFTGYVRINFSQGALARVEKFEEVKLGDFVGVKGTYRKP